MSYVILIKNGVGPYKVYIINLHEFKFRKKKKNFFESFFPH
jgi:hypothetical protein